MRAYKMNGAGNAFIMVDARGEPIAEPSVHAVQALAETYGEFDQLIVLGGFGEDHGLRFWNVDGGEAGACGNGTRAAAWLIYAEGHKGALALTTRDRILTAHQRSDTLVEVDMGQPVLDWDKIPLSRPLDPKKLDYRVNADGVTLEGPGAVSMGNPHCVFTVDKAETVPAHLIGPRVETDALFPERVNVGFAQIIDRTHVRLRVWERGTGLTQACGTGACGALVALHRQDKVDRDLQLTVDGGVLLARWDAASNHVHLAGPVEMDAPLSGFSL